MARSFVKIYFDFDERTEELNEIEKGRLLLAMLRYARTGEKPDLKGNERFCFGSFKSDIDHDALVYSSKLANGNKGGRPVQEKPNVTKEEKPSAKKAAEAEPARKAPAQSPISNLAPEVQSAFREFVAARVKMRKPMTDRAVALAVNKLIEVAGNDPAAQIAAIDRTIEHGWQSFYPANNQQYTPAQPSSKPRVREIY